MDSLACGHNFCKICWGQFLSVSVASGPVCTEVTCPIPKCNVRVPQSKITELSEAGVSEKWNNYMVKSFVDHNRSAKWCPQPGCKYAIEYPGGGVIDVTCPCGPFVFCFGCCFCWGCCYHTLFYYNISFARDTVISKSLIFFRKVLRFIPRSSAVFN